MYVECKLDIRCEVTFFPAQCSFVLELTLGLKDEVLELLNFAADSWPDRFPIDKICELYTHDCMAHMPGYPAIFNQVGENTSNIPFVVHALNDL